VTSASPKPVPRRKLFRWIAAFGSAALALGVIEAVLAAADLPRPSVLSPETAAEAWILADRRIYESDPALLWRVRRGAVIDLPELGFPAVRVGLRGLRGDDRDDEFAKSRLRVTCLGDSITFGVGLADADAYPARLEEALRRRFPDLDPVVINAGGPGYTIVQGRRLDRELAPLRSDVCVWWFGMNDSKPPLGGLDSSLRSPGWFDAGTPAASAGAAVRAVRRGARRGAEGRENAGVDRRSQGRGVRHRTSRRVRRRGADLRELSESDRREGRDADDGRVRNARRGRRGRRRRLRRTLAVRVRRDGRRRGRAGRGLGRPAAWRSCAVPARRASSCRCRNSRDAARFSRRGRAPPTRSPRSCRPTRSTRGRCSATVPCATCCSTTVT